MSFPVVINSSHRVNNNTFTVNLASMMDLSDYSAAIGSCFVYYSWYNISSALNNNIYRLTVPTSGASLNLTLVIPDGAYEISDLNAHLQYFLISQGLYITNNTTGLNTYYCAFAVSPTSYAVTFTTTPLPTSLPSGFTSGGMTFPSSSNQHYQLTVLTNNTFSDIIGFLPGTYPPNPTNVGTYTYSSDITPNVNPISCIQMRLSCLYNVFSSNGQLIDVFTNGSARVGQIIDATPKTTNFVPCQGSHNSLTLQFYDQLGRPLELIDSNVTIKILLKKNN